MPIQPRLYPWTGILTLVLVLVLAPGQGGRAAETLVTERPAHSSAHLFTVSPDGERLYFAGQTSYLVTDRSGGVRGRIEVLHNSRPWMLLPVPGGSIGCNSYLMGHLARYDTEGRLERVLVRKAAKDPAGLRSDMTGWTSPEGAAVDASAGRIFVLDETVAPGGQPSPDWARIAVFDFEGRFVRDLRRYDASAEHPDESLRVWYSDIEVDPKRRRVYVVSEKPGVVLALDYQGKETARWGFSEGGRHSLAVFPDGRVAVGWGGTVQVLDSALRPVGRVTIDPARRLGSVWELETDAKGRLYASTNAANVDFLRWGADLKSSEVVGPRFLRIVASVGQEVVEGPGAVPIEVSREGTYFEPGSGWQVLARPTGGKNPLWQPLPCRLDAKNGRILVSRPPGLAGSYVLSVRFGRGPRDAVWPEEDPSVELPVLFAPETRESSLSVVSDTGRTAFQAGEAVPVHVVRKGDRGAGGPVRLSLTRDGREVLGQVLDLSGAGERALRVPGEVTERLMPGEYRLEAEAAGAQMYPLEVTVASGEPDSPLQRILYHEFRNVLGERANLPRAEADQKAYYREYVRSAARLGFTRETDRWLNQALNSAAGAWNRGPLAERAERTRPGLPPESVFQDPRPGEDWQTEYYLDRAVGAGLSYDTQLIVHCGAAPVRPETVGLDVEALQRAALRLGRYPSFYGFNYNDEMFYESGAGWSKEDTEWIDRLRSENFPDRPRAEACLLALRMTYQRFDEAVKLADPDLKRTTTPMWQFPAAEGSYPPVIYEGMSESYSHFLSEGYDLVWYPAHSVEMLRRPGLPLMGVVDFQQVATSALTYPRNVMQVLARGVQGAGVEHLEIHNLPAAADAYRLTNDLAKWYGPVFAEAPPENEAAVLYSYSQDVTESRKFLGTPHWERVFCMVGAGLMSGVPMEVVYEEDVARGRLLEQGRPRVGMVFLVGQTQPLPDPVRRALQDFERAGGRVLRDEASAESLGGQRVAVDPGRTAECLTKGANGDAWSSYAFGPLSQLASDLRKAVGPWRRYPLDTDDPWVSKNRLDGGQVRYVMLVSETNPVAVGPGPFWTLGSGAMTRQYFPKTVSLTMPRVSGAVYDVFEQKVVAPTDEGEKSRLSVDLSLYPARLYAVAPERLGPPRVQARVEGARLTYRVQVESGRGKPMAARVPMRVRLVRGGSTVTDLARGTDDKGVLQGSLNLPLEGGACVLEVTELLGGSSSRLSAEAKAYSGPLVEVRGPVDRERPRLVRELLKRAKGARSVVLVGGPLLDPGRRASLVKALRAEGVSVRELGALPEQPRPGVVVAVGTVESLSKSKQEERRRDPLWLGYEKGLFRSALGPHVPGEGRGIVTAYLAPRSADEHVIALVGGDGQGLRRAVDALRGVISGSGEEEEALDAVGANGPWTTVSKPVEAEAPVCLRERAGVPLAGVKVAADGKHVVVSAAGFHRNLALVEDQGEWGRLVEAKRVGGSSKVESLYVSGDGQRFGASARYSERFGEAFALFERTPEGVGRDVFSAVGHDEVRFHQFACDDSGDVVLATGSHGVVCWERRTDGSWKERWALDFYREFASLDWPVTGDDERVPSFQAFIPSGSDVAYLLYSDKVNNGWITPNHSSGGWLAAYRLKDGHELWKYELEDRNVLRFPSLAGRLGGSSVALVVDEGSWGEETSRVEVVEKGRLRASWPYPSKVQAAAVSARGGMVACSDSRQGLDVHDADGSLVLSRRWANQPNSLAFNSEGSRLLVADDLRGLTCLDLFGRTVWSRSMPSVSELTVHGDRVYAAGWDGRLRVYSLGTGEPIWTLDLTGALRLPGAKAAWQAGAVAPEDVVAPDRRPTTEPTVPDGPNLVKQPGVQVKVGGTAGWMSWGAVEVSAEALTDGKTGGLKRPWLSLSEQFWATTTGRQVWVEVDFPEPTPVRSVSVFEDPEHPEAWPSDGLLQVWDESLQDWKTAAWGAFLNGAVNTYTLDGSEITRLRYLPWTSYGRNFYTSEIEVR